MYLGEALQRALEHYASGIAVSGKERRGVSFEQQLAFLDSKLGRAGAASRIGVAPATLSRWVRGKSKPTGSSLDKVGVAYRNTKAGPLRKLRQGREAKRRLADATLHIIGTITTSSKTVTLKNALELRGDWSALWPIRRSRRKLADVGARIIMELSDIPGVEFPADDVQCHFE